MDDLTFLLQRIADIEAAAVRRTYGVITDVSPLTATVGAATEAVSVMALDSYSPVVSDHVAVLEVGADRLVLGRTASAPAGPGRIYTGTNFDVATSGTSPATGVTSPSLPLRADRLYSARLGLDAGWYGSTVGDVFTIYLELPGNVGIGTVPVQVHAANYYLPPGSFHAPFTVGTDDDYTVAAKAVRSVGSGTLQFRGRLDIYDDGPA